LGAGGHHGHFLADFQLELEPEGGNFLEKPGKVENVEDETRLAMLPVRSFYSEAV
jgi:hypothetical protein